MHAADETGLQAKVAKTGQRVCHRATRRLDTVGHRCIKQFTPLALMYTNIRTLRLADGPDEVHDMVVGRAEVNSHEEDHAPEPMTWVRPG